MIVIESTSFITHGDTRGLWEPRWFPGNLTVADRRIDDVRPDTARRIGKTRHDATPVYTGPGTREVADHPGRMGGRPTAARGRRRGDPYEADV